MAARDKVAVVGSGISGLTAAYILQHRYDVTLYESDDRLGGHTHTHDVVAHNGETLRVDSGFIVHNERTYPQLLRLFAELGVSTQPTEMSMSVHCDGCGLEYAGARGVRGLFPTAATLRNTAHLATLAQVPRFYRRARRLLESDNAVSAAKDPEPTLGEFLAAGRFSRHFGHHFVVPLVSAVWSCGATDVFAYPARYLFEFLANHGMLSITGSPAWRTVVGGSRTYVERVAKQLTAVRSATRVRSIIRTTDGLSVRDDSGDAREYTAVVAATHADQALRLLGEPTSKEQRVLSRFRYSRNPVTLHSDDSALPVAPSARAAWNYRQAQCHPTDSSVSVSYDMTRLQRLDIGHRYIVTLGSHTAIAPEKVVARMVYEHPIFTPESVAAQQELPALSSGSIAFAGAYHGWGFHEDGCRSGVQAAAALGVTW